MRRFVVLLALAAGCATPARAEREPASRDPRSLTVRADRLAARDEGERRSPSSRATEPREVAGGDLDRRLDTQRITLDFDATPLGQALEFLRDASGINIASRAAPRRAATPRR